MVRVLVTRLASSIAVFLLIAMGLFALVRLAPGDPVEMMVPPDVLGADREAYTAAVRERLGLDQPIAVQFWRWLGGLMTGDLGFSYTNGQPVGDILADRLGPTALLMGSALLIGLIIAVPAGVIAACDATPWRTTRSARRASSPSPSRASSWECSPSTSSR